MFKEETNRFLKMTKNSGMGLAVCYKMAATMVGQLRKMFDWFCLKCTKTLEIVM